jgi:hypothetical protein
MGGFDTEKVLDQSTAGKLSKQRLSSDDDGTVSGCVGGNNDSDHSLRQLSPRWLACAG